jgi:hypothetical protein
MKSSREKVGLHHARRHVPCGAARRFTQSGQLNHRSETGQHFLTHARSIKELAKLELAYHARSE